MRILSVVLTVGWILPCLQAKAVEFECFAQLHHESATAKAGAKHCGNFRFTIGAAEQKQTFSLCKSLSVEFKANGQEYSLELAGDKFAESTVFAANSFPAKFRMEHVVPFREKKHLLSEAYLLSCRQL